MRMIDLPVARTIHLVGMERPESHPQDHLFLFCMASSLALALHQHWRFFLGGFLCQAVGSSMMLAPLRASRWSTSRERPAAWPAHMSSRVPPRGMHCERSTCRLGLAARDPWLGRTQPIPMRLWPADDSGELARILRRHRRDASVLRGPVLVQRRYGLMSLICHLRQRTLAWLRPR